MVQQHASEENVEFSIGDFASLADTFPGIGTTSSYPALLRALVKDTEWQACAVAHYSAYSEPEHIYDLGLNPDVLDPYFRGYYRPEPTRSTALFTRDRTPVSTDTHAIFRQQRTVLTL